MIRDYATYIAIPLLLILAVQSIASWREARSLLSGRKVWPYMERLTHAQALWAARASLANAIIAAVLVALFCLR